MPNGLPELTVDCHTVLIIPIFDLAEEIDVAWFPCVEEQLGERDCERCIPIKLPVQMRCATVCEDLAAQTSSPFFRSSYGRDHRIWVTAKNRDIVLQQ